MPKAHCHFLGLRDDPDTVRAFPSIGNYCHRAEPPEPVSIEYQTSHCFSFAHRHCPVLLASVAAPLPPEIAAFPATNLRNRRIALWSVLAAFAVAIGMFLFFGGWEWAGANWFNDGGNIEIQEPIQMNTPAVPLKFPGSPTPTLLPSPTNTQLPTQFASATSTPSDTLPPPTDTQPPPSTEPLVAVSATSTTAACNNPPANWVVYTVRTGDSLFGIANLVGSSVNELQTNNCLNSDQITVGQRLYLPHLPSTGATKQPTSTPSPTLTLSPSETPVPEEPPQITLVVTLDFTPTPTEEP
jgi:LysM repeat protein